MSGLAFVIAAHHREVIEKNGGDWRSGKGCSCASCKHVREALDLVQATGWTPPAEATVPDTMSEETWR